MRGSPSLQCSLPFPVRFASKVAYRCARGRAAQREKTQFERESPRAAFNAKAALCSSRNQCVYLPTQRLPQPGGVIQRFSLGIILDFRTGSGDRKPNSGVARSSPRARRCALSPGHSRPQRLAQRAYDPTKGRSFSSSCSAARYRSRSIRASSSRGNSSYVEAESRQR
jgi:hypothetical protein